MEIKRCYDTIIGASVGENQLVQSGTTSVTVQSGHKYYAKIDGTESLGTSTGSAITINDSAKDMVIDLSLYLPANIVDYIYQLESATAGSGIAKLREWGFLRGYQAYNSGSIESVEVTGKVVRGFNQWDEEWELGEYDTNGAKVTGRGIRSKNYIPVIPNSNYAFINSLNLYVCKYDFDKNFIERITVTSESPVKLIDSNCYFVTFNTASAYGTTYNNDICINLSSSRNGEYEAYVEQTYDYGDDVLNGIFKLDANNQLYADGDVKTSDGVITRKYKKSAIESVSSVGTSSAGVKYGAIGVLANVKIDGYIMSAIYQNANNASTDMSIRLIGNTAFVYDNRFTDLATAQSILIGMEILYELATPTTEQGDPFPSPQVCYPDGTEEYVTSNGVPVGHETRYEL